jgi:hypothetical protein
MPTAAVAWIGEHAPPASHVFGLDRWGGYLIYALKNPGQSVFVDDRYDFYGEPFLRDYLKVVRSQAGWRQVLDANTVDLVLLPADAPFSRTLHEAADWKLLYHDGVAVVYGHGSASSQPPARGSSPAGTHP